MKRSALDIFFLYLLVLFLVITAMPGLAEGNAFEEQTRGTLAELTTRYTQLQLEAKELKKEEISIPDPPSSPVSCPDEEEAEASATAQADFLQTFLSPEEPLLNQLLDTQRQLQLLGGLPKEDGIQDFGLVSRLEQKALLLIKTYGKDESKVTAVSQAAMKVSYAGELLGVSGQDLLPQIALMYGDAADLLLNRLKEEHDYSIVPAIMEFGRASALLSGDDRDVINRLRDALRFDLEITYTYEQTDNHRWLVSSNFDVQLQLDGENFGSIFGEGTGKLESFVWDDAPEMTVTAPDFAVTAEFRSMDPCAGSVDLLLTPFHPLSETLHDEESSMDWPLLRTSWETLFQDAKQEGGLYLFPLTLTNLDAVPVQETMEQNTPFNETWLEIVLTHTPK